MKNLNVRKAIVFAMILLSGLFNQASAKPKEFVRGTNTPSNISSSESTNENLNNFMANLIAMNRCVSNCTITSSRTWNLGTTFSRALTDTQLPATYTNKTFHFTFERTEGNFFSFSYGLYIKIAFSYPNRITVMGMEGQIYSGISVLSTALEDTTTNFTLAFEEHANGNVLFQVIETDRSKQLVAATTILQFAVPVDDQNLIAEVRKEQPESSSIYLTATAIAAAPEIPRPNRSTSCWNTPLLAVINYFLNSNCTEPQLVQRIAQWDGNNKSLLHVAGKFSQGIKLSASPENIPATLVLERIISLKQENPLAIIAASGICGVSIDDILSPRRIRSPGTENDCIYDTSEIINLYIVLFGESFLDGDHFNTIINNIITTNSTGYAVSDPVMEQAFIALIKKAQQAGESARTLNALHVANTSYRIANSSSLDQEIVPDSFPSTSSAGVVGPASTTANIGKYELNMANYVGGTPANPRKWNGAAWEPASTDYIYSIATTPLEIQLHALNVTQTLRSWETTYGNYFDSSSTPPANASNPSSTYSLASVGASLSHDMQIALPYANAGVVLVEVFYEGAPEAILMGRVDPQQQIAYLHAIVSAPQNVVTPYTTISMRGAGSQATRIFLDYCKSIGIKRVQTVAETTASAVVKTQQGFEHKLKFTDDL
ncbi:hypothetical protein [Edaphovirga cremea]|uniref:hypothetical protein n=1 Tax=Edaphovirga cremea TaxID=2267246 RepID=UPI00130031FC|nr:hypothetical protein [Edaphovirga cremea]